jgi:class 3 adenylate cyclase
MKYFLLPVLLLICAIPHSRAQKQGRELIDSLAAKAPYGINDSNKVLILCKISELYSQISGDTGVRYGEKALALAQEIDWKPGSIYANLALGNNYIATGDHARALSCFFDALKTSEELKDQTNMAASLGNIGNVYYRQKDYDKAFEYYEKAYKMFSALGNKEKMATNLGNMGNIYSHYFDTSATDLSARATNRAKTLEYYDNAYQAYKALNNKNGMARNLGNAGNIYVRDDDKTQALEHYSEAMSMYEELGNKAATAAFRINIAGIYIGVAEDSTGKQKINNLTRADRKALLDKAIAIVQPAVKLSTESGYLEALLASYHSLSTIYAMEGDYKNAYEKNKAYTEIQDSMYRQNNAEAVGKLEAQYKLAQQDKEIQIQKLEVAKKRNTSIFMGVGIALLLLVVVFIARERKKSEQLLLNILPGKIAERLKRKEHPIADQFRGASIMFIDMADFTSFAADKDPKELVSMLNDIFTQFDQIAEKHGLEKIKTIGDCYMAVAGLPQPRADHAIAAADMALEVKERIKDYKTNDGAPVRFRIGLDCGPVVAGVIGSKKFIYDLWGDAVNTASRMESTGVVGEIHCTDNFKRAVSDRASEADTYQFTARGTVEIKGKGKMQTWLLYTEKPLTNVTVL